MPSRKSDPRRSDGSVVVAAPAADADDTPAPPPPPPPPAGDAPADRKDHRDRDAAAIEDLTLPKSIITRLAKGVLPPNTQIQANAILAMSKSATVFISYLASHANEHTTSANKKTISPADVFKALDDIEFSFLRAPLEAEFAKFNAIQTEKRTSYRQRARAAREGPARSDADDADMADHHHHPAPRAARRRAKRPRVEPRDDAETDEEPDDDEAPADDDDADDDDDNDDGEDDVDDDDGEGEGEGEGEGDEDRSGDETQDALEDRTHPDERDEALDADDSD